MEKVDKKPNPHKLLSKIKKCHKTKKLNKKLEGINKQRALLQELHSWLISLGLSADHCLLVEIKKLETPNPLVKLAARRILHAMPASDEDACAYLENLFSIQVPLDGPKKKKFLEYFSVLRAEW